MSAKKTTLYLPDDLRSRLEALAVQRNTTMSELLVEGAEIVLARYPCYADRDEIVRRARQAELELRRGLYRGRSVAADADTLVYRGPVIGARRSP